MSYTELQITSNFSFLRGASHPHEMVDQAVAYGYTKLAITDRNTLAGIVRAHVAAKKTGLTIIPACRLELMDGPSLLAYPTDREAYSRLSALLTTGNLRTEKGQCHLYRQDVYEQAKGIKFIVVPPASLNTRFDFEDDFKNALSEYREALGAEVYLGAMRLYQGDDTKQLYRLAQLAQKFVMPMVATNDVYYHEPQRRELQDILTCIREKCTIQQAGFVLHQHAERHLKPIREMQRLFRQYPDALSRTQEIAEACQFSLDNLQYVYPEEITSEGRTPMEELSFLTWEGAQKRYDGAVPEKVAATLKEELAFMEKKELAAYFLTIHDIVRFARSQQILCQGRGSAANSVVCYCLGITSVDPSKFRLLFARFMSEARDEPPDIDVDFEHERREEVIQYIYQKYGRDRAAIVATVTQEREKGAIKDVGRAMGLSVDTINRLSAAIRTFTDDWSEGNLLTEQGLNPEDPHLRKVLQLTRQLIGFPRQLGQHTGGFVITKGKLSDLCPVMHARMENRTCIEWNKDDIEALGFLKVDILGLGMLTCIRKAFDLAKAHYGLDLTLANVPQDDAAVYNMISHADTIGVFQIESRAQMSMLPRLRPKTFYDLVIEVAIVRPGPIQGDMVHPYLRRRNKEELVTYPSQELKEILNRTCGVPLFQEQAMEIAIRGAGFTPAEADELRRSMATFKANGKLHLYEKKMVDGMVARNYDEGFARRVFKQLQGFEGYGFPESHAVSFALLVYISSWLKCYYPDVFTTALLNSLPMGFYQPAQLVIDAQQHGVEVKAVDINLSQWNNSLEEKSGKYRIIRLGFRQVNGLEEEEMQTLIARRAGGYLSVTAMRDNGVSQTALEKLADADAFRSIDLDRRQALWEVSALGDRPVALFEGQPSESKIESQVALPLMTVGEHVLADYASTTLSLKAHPVSFVREKLQLLHVLSAKEITEAKNGDLVKVAGLILVRQRPGTAGGICFITIEDETGITNLVVFRKLFDQYRKEILQSKLIMVEGRLQKEGEVIHIVLKRCFNFNQLLGNLTIAPAQNEVFHKGRNFK